MWLVNWLRDASLLTLIIDPNFLNWLTIRKIRLLQKSRIECKIDVRKFVLRIPQNPRSFRLWLGMKYLYSSIAISVWIPSITILQALLSFMINIHFDRWSRISCNYNDTAKSRELRPPDRLEFEALSLFSRLCSSHCFSNMANSFRCKHTGEKWIIVGTFNCFIMRVLELYSGIGGMHYALKGNNWIHEINRNTVQTRLPDDKVVFFVHSIFYVCSKNQWSTRTENERFDKV